MLIIPAVDIRSGKCVRLVRGKIEAETVYSEDPVEAAKLWVDQGAPMLHLVDLDGAFSGIPQNLDAVKRIRKAVSVPLQVGGGIRSIDVVEEILSAGIERVILGTAAVTRSDFVLEACSLYPGRIAVGVDGKDGMVAVEGWESTSSEGVLDFARGLRALGVDRVIYTDTMRDGTLEGPNMDGIKQFLEAVDVRVIVSGGISSIRDLHTIAGLKYANLEGVIIGKALYSGGIRLEEALSVSGGKNAG